MENVTVVDAPIVVDALSHLRDRSCDVAMFRAFADRISVQLFSAAVHMADTAEKEIITPLTNTSVPFVSGDFVFITILRAGLAMLPAALQLFPSIRVGLIGLKRDEVTAVAHEYYCNFPEITHESIVLLADPMLATGGSLLHTLEKLAAYSPKEIRIVSVISAPEGIAAIHKKFPDIRIITGAVDNHLNDKKYIVPGLGDFGDRYFATA